jgi:hypothetical protein
MRGPKSTYKIQLSQEEAKHLQQVVQAHKSPQAHVVRAKIVLTANAHPDWDNQRIAHAVGTSDRMVRKWRGRWVATRRLTDAPRSGAPRRFSPSRAGPGHRHGLHLAASDRRAAGALESG